MSAVVETPAQSKALSAVEALKERLAKEIALQHANLPVNEVSKIKLKGKKFTMPDGESSEGPLRAIITNWSYTRSYFPGVYNPNNIKPPVCSSVGENEETLAPGEDVENAQASSCEECPKNAWGSDAAGKGKACKNGIRLAVVPPTPKPNQRPWIIEVSPTGIKQFNKYVNALYKQEGLLTCQVLTDISFDETVDYPTLQFEKAGDFDDLETALDLREKSRKYLL